MKQKQKWLWGLAIAAAVAVGLLSWQLTQGREGSRGVMVKVSNEHGTAYLLGSIHVGSKAMYPFNAAIADAMAQSDAFVFECDTTSDKASAVTASRMAAQPDSLRAAVGDVLYETLSQACSKIGLDVSRFDSLKPWAVINSLAVYSTAAEMGTTNVSEAMALGVESQVRKTANQSGKPTLYLESLDEQLDALESFSEPLQRYLLEGECRVILDSASVTGMDATIAEWPEWWRTGNDAAFAESYLAGYLEAGHEAEGQEYHNTLVAERNARMAECIEALLDEGGTYFVTLGLLHMALPDESVVERLRQKGCTVEWISRP